MATVQTVVHDDEENVVVIVRQPAPPRVQLQTPPSTPAVSVLSRQGPRGIGAYELAVVQGFVGTRDEWLLSLKADATDLVQDHIEHPEPHPSYDDMVDLTLIFENGLI